MRIMNDERGEKIHQTGLVTFGETNFGEIPIFKQPGGNSGVGAFSLLIPAAETFVGRIFRKDFHQEICVFCSKHPLLAVLRLCWLLEPPGSCQGHFLSNINLEFNVCLNMNGHNTQAKFFHCS